MKYILIDRPDSGHICGFGEELIISDMQFQYV
jgi:hypothetical protein